VSTTLVIFGASGDLTRRKLVPALWSLHKDGHLPEGLKVVGIARTGMTDEAFREAMRQGCDAHARRHPVETASWDTFARGLSYQPGDPGDPDVHRHLKEILRGGAGSPIFYLALPPTSFPPVLRGLGQAGLLGDDGRVIVEKPIGSDLESARELNRIIRDVAGEEQVFRIDHYLGKETVRNILVFRFANGMFEPLWNHRHIDHVQITVAERIGIGSRAAYFDRTGVLRDMVQNHLVQLLSLVAMEPPVAFEADAVRDEKVKVLRALRPITPKEIETHAVRGQYGAGSVLGEDVVGYREEEGVRSDSPTETYVALKVAIDNWRWSGVPFYLRTAKRMPKKASEISIHFRRAPHLLFEGASPEGTTSNVLALRIQPDEGISLKFDTKVPGPDIRIHPVSMDFRYGAAFGDTPPDAYEALLLDALEGDGTLFTRRDEVETAWAWITGILEAWERRAAPDFPNYEAGSWGPRAGEDLLRRDGRRWRRP
jgi:glucose-6-phosphate 1-dehydrogenase